MKSKKTKISPGKPPHRGHGSYRGVQIEFIVGKLSEQKDVQAIVVAVNPLMPPDYEPAQNLQAGETLLAPDESASGPRRIYCRAPVVGVDEPAAELLAHCYRNALRLADAHGIESIAVPAISIGASGHPFVEGTEIACRTILEIVPSLSHTKRVRLVFISVKSANIACTLFSQEMRVRV
jgi:O-acetyl-ADP-ribose deacetylase